MGGARCVVFCMLSKNGRDAAVLLCTACCVLSQNAGRGAPPGVDWQDSAHKHEDTAYRHGDRGGAGWRRSHESSGSGASGHHHRNGVETRSSEVAGDFAPVQHAPHDWRAASGAPPPRSAPLPAPPGPPSWKRQSSDSRPPPALERQSKRARLSPARVAPQAHWNGLGKAQDSTPHVPTGVVSETRPAVTSSQERGHPPPVAPPEGPATDEWSRPVEPTEVEPDMASASPFVASASGLSSANPDPTRTGLQAAAFVEPVNIDVLDDIALRIQMHQCELEHALFLYEWSGQGVEQSTKRLLEADAASGNPG